MSKKLYFLISFVLVLTLSGAVQAVDFDKDKYNLSFELGTDGNQLDSHTGIADVLGWEKTAGGFFGSDPWCPCSPPDDTHCHRWPPTDGAMYAYTQHMDNMMFQLLDPSDPNAVIVVGRKYTMLFDGLNNYTDPYGAEMTPTLYYNDNTDPAVELVSERIHLVPIPRPVEDCEGESDLDDPDVCWDWMYDLKLQFVAEAGPSIGQTLGIKFVVHKGLGSYSFVDNVRLTWVWATDAYNPSPADEAEFVARDANLSWTPGLWAKKHIVYFSDDVNKVSIRHQDANQGIQDVNLFDPTPGGGQLVLGRTYYWSITEVNDSYVPVPTVPDPPWLGDVWSFTVAGRAFNPNPEDSAEDVSLYTDLSWTPGTDVNDVNGHDVYFGTGEAAVDDANQSSSEYMGRQDANDFNDFVPTLELGKKYYWRIDEVNGTAGTLIKGKVWSFTVATYFRVDDMDSYVNDAAIRAVWKDFSSGSLWGKNGAEVFVETSPDHVIDGNSMRYYFRNRNTQASVGYVGSEAEANTSDLESGSNWSKGGIKALVLYFYGDATNLGDTSGVVGGIHQDQMYVALEDGDDPCGTGIVKWPDMNDIKEPSWHEWNIELADPCLADVNMANIAKVYIGFGGQKMGQTEMGAGKDTFDGDTVWFDDIRLYPPRCVPEYAHLTGSFRYLNHYEVEGSFVSDCKNDYFDLWSMGSDWLVSSYGVVTATPPGGASLMGHWTLDDDAKNSDVNDVSVNNNDGVLYDDVFKDAPKLGKTDAHHTDDCAEGTGALVFDGIDDFIEIPALDLNSNTVTISAWIKRDGDLGAEGTYPPIVSCNEPNGFKFCFGSTAEYDPMAWAANNELCYFWTGWSWDAHSGLIVPDSVWSFVALVVEPDKGTLYLYDGLSMKSSVNYEYHKVYDFNDVSFFGGAGFKGAMDDVYIYNRALSPEEILGLAGLSGTHYLALEPWRADANNDDKVDLKDYVIMAKNWLKEVLWPFE